MVETILARHERLREDWPVDGTTGYDFLNQLNGFLLNGQGERAATRAYHRFIGRDVDVDELICETKHLIMEELLGGELSALARDLGRISERHWSSRDYTLEGLRRALRTVIVCFPVYRTYVTRRGCSATDRRDIAWAMGQARKRWRGSGREIFDFIEAVLTTDLARPPHSGYSRSEVTRFAMRFQQYTGPVTAKSLEDTALYRYPRLISLNEVGADPRHFGLSSAAFHHLNQERARRWPRTMLASSTHDTKRREDVRARINVLSEIPGEWVQHVTRWAVLNKRKKQEVDDRLAPSRNDEYLLYQTLVGAWPPDVDPQDEQDLGRSVFVERLQAYVRKAVREAHERSSWDNPNEPYETAFARFIAEILDPKLARLFLHDFLGF